MSCAGGLCFLADLMREVSLPVSVDFLSISTPGADAQGVRITKELDTSIEGKDVILVEDVVDTGMSLRYITNYLQTKKPASLEVCALLDKKIRRIADMPLRYVGFEVPDEFLVGYGLDYLERYRNLPFIGVLKPEALEDERGIPVGQPPQPPFLPSTYTIKVQSPKLGPTLRRGPADGPP